MGSGVLIHEKDTHALRLEKLTSADGCREPDWISTHLRWLHEGDVFRVVGHAQWERLVLIACESAYSIDNRTWGVGVSVYHGLADDGAMTRPRTPVATIYATATAPPPPRSA
jgi:hypothetical protein